MNKTLTSLRNCCTLNTLNNNFDFRTRKIWRKVKINFKWPLHSRKALHAVGVCERKSMIPAFFDGLPFLACSCFIILYVSYNNCTKTDRNALRAKEALQCALGERSLLNHIYFDVDVVKCLVGLTWVNSKKLQKLKNK